MRRVVVLVSCLALVALAWPAVVSAQAGTVVHTAQVQAADVLAYWTPQRMAAARPAVAVLPGKPSPPGEGNRPGADPGLIKSSTGGDWPLAEAGPEELLELARTVELPEGGYTYPPPENTWVVPVAWHGSFPLRAVGKMYFSRNGVNYEASAASVGHRAVMTAAGNLHDIGGGVWSTNILFIPALREGWEPFGVWAWDGWAIVPTQWVNDADWCRDVGFFRVADQGGKTLSETVGHLGFAWDAGEERAWTVLGYPRNNWSGKVMVATDASFSRSDRPLTCLAASPSAVGIGSRQGMGTFGGPWILDFRAQQSGANNYANGVFAYLYADYPYEFFSPYMDAWVHDHLWLEAIR